VSNVSNDGINLQTDVELNVDVNSGSWTGVSQSVDIPVGGADSLIVSTQYTPAAVPGPHAFTWEITQTEIDDIPANNIIAGDSFDVTDFIYAHDKDAITGGTGNQGEPYEAGNFFDIWADQTLYFVDIKLFSSTQVGSTVYAKLYSFDGTQATFAAALDFEQQSDYHVVQASDLGSVISLPLLLPTNLTAAQGTYFVVAATDGDGGASDDVVIATSGISPNGFSYQYIPAQDTWFLQPETPIVRLNFDGTFWGLNEQSNVSALNIFPNPAQDVLNVNYNVINASDVKVEVLDITGKTIALVSDDSNVLGAQQATINTSSFAAGVYHINITTNEGMIKSKFVKQ
jgi:hypothetical protein